MDFMRMHLQKKGSFTKRDISHVVYLATKPARDAALAHEWRREQSTPYNETEKAELNAMISQTTAYLGDLLYSHKEGKGRPLTDKQATDIALALLEAAAIIHPEE